MSKLCRKCKSIVIVSEVQGYSYYCPQCDEDLYIIETED